MSDTKDLLVVGNPNVGKSVIFGLLTGRYAVVSNYPGTTVEISRGTSVIGGTTHTLLDTPGANSCIFPTSDDEVVTRDVLARFAGSPVIQVADAKNLQRALVLTIELAEYGCPVVLALNMSDEARTWGTFIDHKKLGSILGIPVVPTVATERLGIAELRASVQNAAVPKVKPEYLPEVEKALAEVMAKAGVSRGVATAAISRPDVSLPHHVLNAVEEASKGVFAEHHGHIGYELLLARARLAEDLARNVTKVLSPEGEKRWWVASALTAAGVVASGAGAGMALGSVINGILDKAGYGIPVIPYLAAALLAGWFSWLLLRKPRERNVLAEAGSLAMRPLPGTVMLVGVLYFAYYLVGVLVAGHVVDFLMNTVIGSWEEDRWGGYILGPLSRAVESLLGRSLVYRALFDADGGAISKGLSYSFGIVGPIVIGFFFILSFLEDTGYLPRLAVVSDRVFKKMGLSGKAALPMVLGLGCDTMATLATRVLASRKERLLAILLMALGIPCSAQLGIIASTLASLNLMALLLFAAIIIGVLVIVGAIGARILPGENMPFLMEIPPFRPPLMRNILLKTYHRSLWFLKEAVPVFIIGSFVLWIMKETAVLGVLEKAASPIVTGVLGLPAETARSFLLGFLRRDYAAIAIFDLFKQGVVGPNQVFVALVTVTLFVPCVANFLVMIKEAGMRNALYMVAFIVPCAFAVGGLVRLALLLVGVDLGQ